MSTDALYMLIIILLLAMAIFLFYAGKALGKRYMFEVMNNVIEKERADAIKKSRGVLTGQISEQLAPLAPNFPALHSECRFVGKPIDFVAFRGLDEKFVNEIVFIEVKTGKSQMSPVQRSIRDTIKAKRVRFEEYHLK